MSVNFQHPQIEVAQNETAAPSGFFMLSHRVFTEPRLAKLTGDTFKLYLWMSSRAWRFPTSDGTLRAAISFISKGTLMPHATISRALKSLINEKLISIKVVDYKNGNLWFVTPLALGKMESNLNTKVQDDANQLPQSEAPQLEGEKPSKRVCDNLKLREEDSHFEGEIRKYNKTYNSKNLSLSSEIFPEPILKYLKSLKSRRKLEREIRAYSELKNNTPQERILDAFLVITQSATSKALIHSPLSYLAEAIDDVLKFRPEVRISTDSGAERQDINEANQNARPSSIAPTESSDDLEWTAKRQLFEQSFPVLKQREEFIQKVISCLPWTPMPEVALNIAISAWASGEGQKHADMSH